VDVEGVGVVFGGHLGRSEMTQQFLGMFKIIDGGTHVLRAARAAAPSRKVSGGPGTVAKFTGFPPSQGAHCNLSNIHNYVGAASPSNRQLITHAKGAREQPAYFIWVIRSKRRHFVQNSPWRRLVKACPAESHLGFFSAWIGRSPDHRVRFVKRFDDSFFDFALAPYFLASLIGDPRRELTLGSFRKTGGRAK
jgi:hypothetical protein